MSIGPRSNNFLSLDFYQGYLEGIETVFFSTRSRQHRAWLFGPRSVVGGVTQAKRLGLVRRLRATERLGSLYMCMLRAHVDNQNAAFAGSAIKFCVKLNKSASETLGIINKSYRMRISRTRKDRMSKSKVKAIVIVSFDSNGVGYRTFLHCGQVINWYLLCRSASTPATKGPTCQKGDCW